jgi:hypothetical protein
MVIKTVLDRVIIISIIFDFDLSLPLPCPFSSVLYYSPAAALTNISGKYKRFLGKYSITYT